MRLRHSAGHIQRKAAPDPELKLRDARLYVITDDPATAEAAVRGGAEILQLRHKNLARGELIALARRMREIARDVVFVVNDFVDIALLSGADGVHLGPDDVSVESARRIAGDQLLIGASASTIDAAHKAVAGGADYLGSGPAFSTPIKAEKRVIGPSGIAEIAKSVGVVPVFAIGGIDESNIAHVIEAGLHRVCVIRAVGGAPDPEAMTRRLRAMLDL